MWGEEKKMKIIADPETAGIETVVLIINWDCRIFAK